MAILRFIGLTIATLGSLASIGLYFWARDVLDIEFKDVSHEPAYQDFIGARYETTQDAYIIKIEQDNGPIHGKALIYSVMETKINGDDFLLNEMLPAHTTFQLEKIVRSKGGSNNEAAIINFTSTSKYSDAPVYFDHTELMVRNAWTIKID